MSTDNRNRLYVPTTLLFLIAVIGCIGLGGVNLYFMFLREHAPGRTVSRTVVRQVADPAPASRLSPAGRECYPLAEWCGADLDGEELAEARRLLSGIIPEGIPTQERIALLCRHLLLLLDERRGTPDERVRGATPLETYRMAKEGETPIWCSNFALIYYLFANACEIATRRVSIGRISGGEHRRIHALCESYIPEQRRWACVDLTARILAVRDSGGRVFDTIGLAGIVRSGGDAEALVYRAGRVDTVRYADSAAPHRHYLGRSAIIEYHLPDRATNDLSRYLRKPRTLLISGREIRSYYRERLVLLWLWALSCIALAVLFQRRRREKRFTA